MSTLYRDYRPKNFAEVLGQNHVKIALKNEIIANQPANAYLFCGPRAVGKTTLARILAKSLNCEQRKEGESEPCSQCDSCQSIANGNSLDVVEIDAASNTGVDNVRENIIAFARIAPAKNKYRVFIIDEVHMLSISAWNALLKTLEEPPQRVIFVLCTTEIHKVPETIISRCERYTFKRIALTDIVGKLQRIVSQEKAVVDNEILEAIARQSTGHLRDAESLLGQVLSLGDGGEIGWEQAELIVPRHYHDEVLSLLDLITKKDIAGAIKLVNNAADSGLNLKNLVTETIDVLRKIMLYQANPNLADNYSVSLTGEAEIQVSELASRLKSAQVIHYLEAFLELYNDKTVYSVPQLPLEIKIIELSSDDLPQATKPIIPQNPINKIAQTKTTTIKPESNLKNGPIAADLAPESVKERWPDFLARVKANNYSLSFVLQNCATGSIKDGELTLTFKYKFHRDRIADPQIRPGVEQVLADVYGGCVSIVLAVDENLNLAKSKTKTDHHLKPELKTQIEKSESEPTKDNLLDNLLQTFGGEVVS